MTYRKRSIDNNSKQDTLYFCKNKLFRVTDRFWSHLSSFNVPPTLITVEPGEWG